MSKDPGAQQLERLLRRQAEACAQLGSSLYAQLMTHAADDAAADGQVRSLLRGHEDDPDDSALALRLFGAVHRLVLGGQVPELAAFYPSAGGRFDARSDGSCAWSAWLDAARLHAASVRADLDRPLQTNEVGRAAVLIGGLLHLMTQRALPVRLVELGASAGLNLRADACRIEWEGGAYGPAASPVQLTNAWQGRVPSPGPLAVIERVGYDVHPLDPTTAEGALRLASYVWPDQLDRLARLRGAIALSRRFPASVRRGSALDALRELTLRDGAWTVVWHSIVWQYLGDDERAAVQLRLDELGQQATPTGPLAHLAFEPGRRGTVDSARDSAQDRAQDSAQDRAPHGEDRGEFLLGLRTWPGGEKRILGAAAPHGLPVTWD